MLRYRLKKLFHFTSRVISPCILPLVLFRQRLGGSIPIPILQYHKVCDMPWETTDCRYDNVLPTNFEKQMLYLSRKGYNALDFEELHEILVGQLPLPAKPVVITFDDGWKSVKEFALPILRRYGLKATVFLAVNFVDKGRPIHSFDEAAKKHQMRHPECWEPLSWNDVICMRADGMVFECHSMNHLHLATLDRRTMEAEVMSAKARIEEMTGVPVRHFAYPYGADNGQCFNSTTTAVLKEAGFRLALTSVIGCNYMCSVAPFKLKRLPILEDDGLIQFRSKLVGAADWVALAQRSFQRCFREPLQAEQGLNHS